MEDDKKTAQIGIRVTPAFRDALALCAAREIRSISQQAELFIREGLLRYHEQNPDFTPQWDTVFGEQHKNK